MLSKTLKHDLRNFLPLWLFLSVIALCSSVIFGLSLREMIFFSSEASVVFGGLGMTLSIAVLSGYAIATVVFVAVRFYQNFYTDEGYLTFTLPVKRSTLFFSKVLSGVIFVGASSVVIIVSVVLALLMVPSSAADNTPVLFEVIEFLWIAFESLFQNISDQVTLIMMLVLGLLIVLCFLIYEILALYLCITVGSVIAKKHKVIASILCYYGANFIISMFSSFTQVVSLLFAPHLVMVIGALPEPHLRAVLILVGVALLGIMMLLSSLIYWATQKLIEKKLNLP